MFPFLPVSISVDWFYWPNFNMLLLPILWSWTAILMESCSSYSNLKHSLHVPSTFSTDQIILSTFFFFYISLLHKLSLLRTYTCLFFMAKSSEQSLNPWPDMASSTLVLFHLFNLFVYLLWTYEKSLNIILNHNMFPTFHPWYSWTVFFVFIKIDPSEFRLCCSLAEKKNSKPFAC